VIPVSSAILFGPPGTGKTYWARRAALDLAAIGAFGRRFEDLSVGERDEVEGTEQAAGLVCWCTFHPAFGYEDFIEGFRPEQGAAGQLVFERRAGIFKTLCDLAERMPDRKFVLVVDEINRGDIPRIFGELLTLLERDKRGLKLKLPLSGNSFAVAGERLFDRDDEHSRPLDRAARYSVATALRLRRADARHIRAQRGIGRRRASWAVAHRAERQATNASRPGCAEPSGRACLPA
jgi:hypothetical protein